MAQQNTNISVKTDGDTLSASEFNDLNQSINDNSQDFESRATTLLGESESNELRITIIEDTVTSNIASYSTANLPNDLTNGTIVYDTDQEIPVYIKSGSWYRLSDDTEIV